LESLDGAEGGADAGGQDDEQEGGDGALHCWRYCVGYLGKTACELMMGLGGCWRGYLYLFRSGTKRRPE
jgi:hypothetical protein